MRPGRPRQHVHKWEMKFTKFEWEDKVTQYSFGGFNALRYWACTRGGKVKHIFFQPKDEKQVFIQGSGISSARV